jgi:hypothetical protein
MSTGKMAAIGVGTGIAGFLVADALFDNDGFGDGGFF